MTDEQLEQLASKLAVECKWSGDWIMKVAALALTDANFHNESEVIEQMLTAIEATDDTPKYKLTILEQED